MNGASQVPQGAYRVADSGEYRIDNPCRLIINYVPQSITPDIFSEIFVPYGRVVHCKLMMDKKTHSCLGYGFVEYQTKEEAARAMHELNGVPLLNKRLKVSYARDPSTDIKDSNVYIAGFGPHMGEESLGAVFSDFGTVMNIHLLRDEQGISRGAAFVRMNNNQEAANAVKCLNGSLMMGRVVYAKIHIPLPFRRNQKIKGKGTSNGGGSKRDNSGSVELHLYSPTSFDSQNIQSTYPQYNQSQYSSSQLSLQSPQSITTQSTQSLTSQSTQQSFFDHSSSNPSLSNEDLYNQAAREYQQYEYQDYRIDEEDELQQQQQQIQQRYDGSFNRGEGRGRAYKGRIREYPDANERVMSINQSLNRRPDHIQQQRDTRQQFITHTPPRNTLSQTSYNRIQSYQPSQRIGYEYPYTQSDPITSSSSSSSSIHYPITHPQPFDDPSPPEIQVPSSFLVADQQKIHQELPQRILQTFQQQNRGVHSQQSDQDTRLNSAYSQIPDPNSNQAQNQFQMHLSDLELLFQQQLMMQNPVTTVGSQHQEPSSKQKDEQVKYLSNLTQQPAIPYNIPKPPSSNAIPNALQLQIIDPSLQSQSSGPIYQNSNTKQSLGVSNTINTGINKDVRMEWEDGKGNNGPNNSGFILQSSQIPISLHIPPSQYSQIVHYQSNPNQPIMYQYPQQQQQSISSQYPVQSIAPQSQSTQSTSFAYASSTTTSSSSSSSSSSNEQAKSSSSSSSLAQLTPNQFVSPQINGNQNMIEQQQQQQQQQSK